LIEIFLEKLSWPGHCCLKSLTGGARWDVHFPWTPGGKMIADVLLKRRWCRLTPFGATTHLTKLDNRTAPGQASASFGFASTGLRRIAGGNCLKINFTK
jgi:hypothetical protein